MTCKNHTWVLAIVFVLLNSCKPAALDEVILIPNNYEGDLILILNQPNGQTETIKDNKLITRFSENGIIQAKYNTPEDWHQVNYYYYNKLGDTTKLEELGDQDSIDSSKIYVLDVFTRATLDKQNPFEAIIYIVGRLSHESKLKEAASERYEELRKSKTLSNRK
ncbi:DUF6843 domain-containing protein [Owenweeksia hongkongensis]|uniref:DUF6843 domain-containing protein n=1 Tax=Owenweeksia hongkongensis TaxID=253245 RepID=UPI003A90AA37